jgi:hypothetical protein
MLGVMKTVRLKLRTKDDSVVAEIEGTFSPADLALLEQYAQHLQRVRDTTLLTRGMPSITNMSWNAGVPMTFACAQYSNAELYELLHVLRPVILESEAASFHKIQRLLGRAFRNKDYASHQKAIRRIFEDGELSLYMQVSIGGQPLLDDSLLKIWLNGTQYHTDAEKAAAWSSLEASLTTQNARAVVITQLQSRVKALMLLQHEVGFVLGAPHDA